jgi:hypothetical protein
MIVTPTSFAEGNKPRRKHLALMLRNSKDSNKEIYRCSRTLFFVLFTASALFGQTNATLRGLITDQSGAGQVVEQRVVQEIPLNGTHFLDLGM